MSTIEKIKLKVYSVIREDDENTLAGNLFDGTLIVLIILNVLLVVFDTFSLPGWYVHFSSIAETVSVIVFTIEYLLRLWTSDLKYPDRGKISARLHHMITFMSIIDLLAILPFYLPFLIPVDLRVLRVLRILRLFRLFKFSRYTTAFRTIGSVFKNKAHQLLSSIFVVLLLMVIASVLMYNVEHDAQPEQFSNAFSGLWWAIATLTTVGYGDIYPVTALGKLLAAMIAMLGIGLVAVPTGIISAGFVELIEKNPADESPADAIDKEKHDSDNDSKHYCPYCGHKLDE